MESPATPLPMMWGAEYGQDGRSGPVYGGDAGRATGSAYGVYGADRRVSGARAVGNETLGGSETGLEYPREPSGLGREYGDEEGGEEGEEEEEDDSEDELQAGEVYGRRPGVRTRR